jgi:alpha-amylase/alpha-mannosidase (GH57 family)
MDLARPNSTNLQAWTIYEETIERIKINKIILISILGLLPEYFKNEYLAYSQSILKHLFKYYGE